MGEQRISYLVRHAQLTAIGVGVAAQHISAVGIRLASEAAPEMADRSLFRAAEPSAFVALHTRARIGRAYRAVFRAFLIRAARRAIVQRVARKTNVTVFRGPWITALDTPGRGWPRRSVDGNLLACEAERRRRPAVAVLATRRAAGRAQIAVRARLKETVGLPSGRASEPVRDRAHGRIGKSTFSHAVIQTAAHSTQPQPQQQPQQQRTSSAHIGSHVPCVEQATVPTVISLRHVSSTPVHATHWPFPESHQGLLGSVQCASSRHPTHFWLAASQKKPSVHPLATHEHRPSTQAAPPQSADDSHSKHS